jgi:hypothetical protein
MKSGPQELAAYYAAQHERSSKRMTTSEKDALRELNITPEQLAEKLAKVNALLHPQTDPGDSTPANSAKPAKKPRSDKGTKRVKTTDPQPTGALSREQASRGLDLVQTRDRLRVKWDAAIANEEDAAANFVDADAEVVAWFGEITRREA